MTTHIQAYNEMAQLFKDAWDTTGFAAVYNDVPPDAAAIAAIDVTSGTVVPWARFATKPNFRTQRSLGGPGGRRFDSTGIVIVEIYTPTGDGLTLARSLHTLVEQAFEGVSTLNGVWFRNVRTEPAAVSGPWSHSNIIAEYQYDEVR